mmetsp:Transcript_38830/g.85031  ORF Transcript_38830/g.85031 Transcript_38830/m.85031 type:complete len:86 (-) Transcript_38830:840-1097(-)
MFVFCSPAPLDLPWPRMLGKNGHAIQETQQFNARVQAKELGLKFKIDATGCPSGDQHQQTGACFATFLLLLLLPRTMQQRSKLRP